MVLELILGHYAKSCPNQDYKTTALAQNPRGCLNTRAYNLNKEDVKVGPSMLVLSQLFVSNMQLYTLIDWRAAHLYITSRLSDRLDGNKQIMSTPFITTTLVDDMYKSILWFKDMPIRIQDYMYYTNLIEFGMVDYDVILGMDCVTTRTRNPNEPRQRS